MIVTQPPRPRSPETGFVLGGFGGIGGEAVRHVHDARAKAPDDYPPCVSVTMDTDSTPEEWSDISIKLGMTESTARAVMDNHELYGPDVSRIVEWNKIHGVIRPENLEHGSQTNRLVTQFLFASQWRRIVPRLREALIHLHNSHDGRLTRVVFLTASSTGGGAGSALQTMLARALQSPEFRVPLLAGFAPDMLKPLAMFLADPYAHAQGVLRDELHRQANRILANAYALRLETAELEKRRAISHCFHVGFASPRVILDTKEKIVHALGSSVGQVMRHWSLLRSRHADIRDIAMDVDRFVGK